MNDQQGSKRISSGVIAAVSATVVAVSGGVAWLTSQQQPPTPNTPNSTTTEQTESANTQRANEQTANIYWLQPKGENINLVPQPVEIAAATPNQFLEKAIQTLLSGPTEGTESTTIPEGTKLLALKTENDEIHINLSSEFTSGGGSSSMMGRLGQIIYTATTLNPKAKVYIDVDGEPLEVLGGEGLEVQQPLTRQSFAEDYPL